MGGGWGSKGAKWLAEKHLRPRQPSGRAPNQNRTTTEPNQNHKPSTNKCDYCERTNVKSMRFQRRYRVVICNRCYWRLYEFYHWQWHLNAGRPEWNVVDRLFREKYGIQ